MKNQLFGVCSLIFLTVNLSPSTAPGQDQLSDSLGVVSGGNASDSFVLIASGLPSAGEVALATIDGISSAIECVHVAGVSSFPASHVIGATGTLVIQGGGTLESNFVDLGGGEAGHGTLVVRGQGSKLLENPVGDPNCAQNRTHNVTVVGFRSFGSLLLADGAELDTLFLPIGNEAGSSGSVRVLSQPSCDPMAEPRQADCSQLNVIGVAVDGSPTDLGFPAFGNVGRFGTGQLVLQRGRVFVSLNGDAVTDSAKAGHGFNIGRGARAVGSVVLSDQSKFLIESSGVGNDLAWTAVGRSGTGSLEISGGSLFKSQGANGFFVVARDPGSVGSVTLKDAGSMLMVDGLVALSRTFDDTDGGVSLLTLDAGTELFAGEIDAHANTTIFSNGTITVTGTFTMAGVFNPGFSPGEAVINGNVTFTPTGLLRLEIVGANAADSLIVNGNLACDDCLIAISLSNGATLDGINIGDLVNVSGSKPETLDVIVVNEEGKTIASINDAPVFDGGTLGDNLVSEVQIDIKPDSSENTINLASRGVLVVAILGSASFDATKVDPASVRLSSADVRMRGNGTFATDEEDVNGDGHIDLVLQVETTKLDLTEASETVFLEGRTTIGTRFEGSDLIRVVQE